MRECHDEPMRDALPLLARGLLPAAEAATLRAHLAGCASCADELALLERSARLFDASTPRVDTAAIVRAVQAAAPAARPSLTVQRGGTGPRLRMPRYALAAAASLVLVATLSFAALQDRVFGTGTTPEVTVDSAVPASPATAPGAAAAAPVALGGSDLADLGEAELEALLSELDRLEATVAADPMTLQRAVVQTPEVM